MVVLLWALLRLPDRQVGREAAGGPVRPGRPHARRHGRHLRLVRDRCATTGESSAGGESLVPMITIGALGLIVSLAFVKVAMSGLGGLDRVAGRLLAAAAVVGAVGGALFPLLFEVHPGLSGSQILRARDHALRGLRRRPAAPRRRRSAAGAARRRVFSVVPYVAVAATDALLLRIGHAGPAAPCSRSRSPRSAHRPGGGPADQRAVGERPAAAPGGRTWQPGTRPAHPPRQPRRPDRPGQPGPVRAARPRRPWRDRPAARSAWR